MAAPAAHLPYRADVDGLRGLAVLSVMGFHAFPQGLSGGFIGVDVFFVISGYLITGIIFKTAADGTFSFADFYYRRIVRLFPALIVVLAFCVAFGWFYLLTGDYQKLGRDIAAGVGFVSNFVAIEDAGYFDRAASLKPLLHLWSLGVEEQFYLLWPAIVVAAFRNRRLLGGAILATFALSFAGNVWLSAQNPVVDFYSPVSRFWELMVGAALAFAQLDPRHPGAAAGPRLAQVQSLAGLGCLAAAAIVFTERMPFPGWAALLPVTGTALLVAAGPRTIVNRVMLSNRLLVGIGLISYPLYLWHWPLLALSRLATGAAPDAGLRLGLMALSFVLALLTFLLVERPLRALPARTLKTAALCVSIGLVGIAGAAIHRLDGVPSRFPLDISALAAITDGPEFFHFRESVRTGICHDVGLGLPADERRRQCIETKRPLLFLWGDSFAAALYPGLKRLQQTKSFGIGQMTHGHAPPFFQRNKEAAIEVDLYALNEQKLEDVAQSRPELVLLSWNVQAVNTGGTPAQQVDALAETVRRINAASPATRIAVVGPFPAWQGSLIKAMVTYWETTHELPPPYMRTGLLAFTRTYDDYMKEHLPPLGVSYISALDILCNDDGCLTRLGSRLDDLTATDFAHPTPNASEYLAGRFADRLWELLESRGTAAARRN